jgi:hypothetical protein
MHQRNRATNVLKWTDEEYWLILLRQFKRLLAEQGQDLADAELRILADRMTKRQLQSEPETGMRAALIALVEESLNVLRKLGLDYARSLETEMDQLSGWETTADFIALANEKANAELRISVGAALLAGLGDDRFADVLLTTYLHGKDDPEDVDAIIAQRALGFAAQIPASQPEWQSKIATWLQNRRTS